MSSPTITPYRTSIPDSSLSLLTTKLATTTFPPETTFTDNWDYGASLTSLKRLVSYWKNGFDWRTQEKMLNEKLPQFMTTVEVEGFGELEIHFVHQKSEERESIPLLFCHGWPGSFLEVIKILPLLTRKDGDGPSFHVVAPSLPNFGFSEGPKKPGFGIPQYAEAMHKVMLNLGYDKYVTQGGDWGFEITRTIGIKYPHHCLASHLNYIEIPPFILPTLTTPSSLSSLNPAEKAGLERTNWFLTQGFGYNTLQSTRPHTLAFLLSDSPLSLLSWIFEKLHDWTDSYPFTDDEILTWVSIYWFSRAGPGASVGIYYEATHGVEEEMRRIHEWNDRVKLGVSLFPRDLCVPPDGWAGKRLGKVVFERRHTDGGHFAAYERPEVLVGDLREMFGKGELRDVVERVRV